MDAGEFADWKRLHRFEPWGEPAADERLKILLSGVFNSHGPKTARTNRDFDFTWGEAETPKRILLDFTTGAQLLAGYSRPR